MFRWAARLTRTRPVPAAAGWVVAAEGTAAEAAAAAATEGQVAAADEAAA
jgi:hypothetical protein